jgi:hypothetical protein
VNFELLTIPFPAVQLPIGSASLERVDHTIDHTLGMCDASPVVMKNDVLLKG